MNNRFQVAVIGAGMAGLTAANTLARAGKRVLLLEASARCGGRAFTEHGAGGLAIELGAEFVHGKPEPTLALARAAGVRLDPIKDRHFAKQGGRFVEQEDPWQPFASILSRVESGESDESARAFLERHAVSAEASERFRQLVEGFEAAPVAEVSIQSLAADSSSLSEDDSQFRVAGGYGALVEYLSRSALDAGVELHLDSPVARVRITPKEGVLLDLAQAERTFECRTCIVAVPLGVLQSQPGAGGLQFEPPIPELARPLTRLAMGHACRFVLHFAEGFGAARLPPGATFFHEPTLPFETFWCQSSPGRILWTTWAGGPKARLLARETPAHRQQLAIGALANLLDLEEEAVQAALLGAHHHDFSNDLRAHGAYSFMRPGGMGAAKELSEPFASGALFIAGEATDHRYPGTVAGALASGERAAQQILEMLG